MPPVRHQAEIDVRAPASMAFDVVVGDIMKIDDDHDAVAGHRPIDAGPLRLGWRWQQTLVHERVVCRTDWTVTALEEPHVLEQSFSHMCAANRAFSEGGERWEFIPAEDGSTQVKLSHWMVIPGLDGWLRRMFGSSLRREWQLSLKRRLNAVQFEAERRSAA